MNKLVVVLSTAVIILSIVSGFLFYQLNTVQNQINTIEARLSNYPPLVKIVEFSSTPKFSAIGGVLVQSKANVTIENIGVNDVEGLNLTIIHSSQDMWVYNEILDVLHSGEKRTINGCIFWNLTYGTVTVTLKLGNVTLDEYIVPNFPN